ncbi:MAG: hypothetical protein IKO26_03505 [Paludibacteraceae bacterium]|nr:hypothetical protein [Paludibacteraceae bacterium]
MKKIFTFIAALAATLSLSAKETTVWTGNEPISWNAEVYAGTQFETPEGIFAGLQKDYTIKVSVTPGMDEPQYVMTYKAGDSWNWTDLTTTIENGTMSYTVESAQIATEIADRGLIFRGQGYNITAIIVDDNTPDTPDPQPTDRVAETLWEGTQVLGAEGNDGFGIEAAKLQNLALNDSIAITITDLTDSYCQINIAANNPWTAIPGTNWESLNAAGTYRYAVADADLVANIKASGLTIQGKLCTVTKLQLLPYQEPGDDPQPQPETKEYEDQTVWTGNTAISWNSEEYPGVQFDTFNEKQDMLAGLAKDDSIKIYYAEAIEGAQFALTYKAGENWDWTDLAVTNHTSFFAYKVATDEIAQDIADHGLVIRGQGYHLTSIVIGKPQKGTSGIENTVSAKKDGATKVLRNGQLYILRDGKIFNALGQPVSYIR